MLADAQAGPRTAALRERALELGFHAFGVARAAAPDPEERLRAWLDAGMHGRMAWMADPDAYARRMSLERALPGARSVVALSVSYHRPEAEPSGPLRIARYAMGADYHRWLKRRTRKLRKRLLELDPGCRVYPTVDTSPMLERAWAARAGIAWIGKSTMAIHPRLGTYTFLATLVTDSLLEPSPGPLPDRCGSCTACLDACPTQAFPEPGVLDARRCIAHWTLEAPGELPPDAPDFAGWVAGCDICQEVCPWNKFARPADEPRTQPREGLSRPSVATFTDPSASSSLEATLAGTALARTGAAAIRRNARRVLGLPRGPAPGGAPETEGRE
jgi:epoxyqueuosine reductase